MILESIQSRIKSFAGEIGITYIDIVSGKTMSAGNADVFPQAGLVMMFGMIEAYKAIDEGRISKLDKYVLKKTDCNESKANPQILNLGALSYLHEGIELTIEDLYKLAIISGDTIAFNILLRLLGKASINETIRLMGFDKTVINREMNDLKSIKKGIENYVSVSEMANLFYRIYRGQVISGSACREMLNIMKYHQNNSVIPYNFNESFEISHITSTDDAYLMDAGIVYGEKPFVLVMAAHDKNIRNAEMIMRDVTKMCYLYSTEKTE